MKIKGQLINIGTGSTISNLPNEKSCTLTIDKEFVQGSGEERGQKNTQKNKGWSIRAQMLLDSTSSDISYLSTLITSMRNSTTVMLHFRSPSADNKYLHIYGPCIITRLSLAGQGRSIVSVSLSATGSGQPTIVELFS